MNLRQLSVSVSSEPVLSPSLEADSEDNSICASISYRISLSLATSEKPVAPAYFLSTQISLSPCQDHVVPPD